MERDTLVRILERAEAAVRRGDRFEVGTEHDVTLFLGKPGSAMPIQHVTAIALAEDFVEIEARERGTLYTTYDAIHGVAQSPKKEQRQNRAGF